MRGFEYFFSHFLSGVVYFNENAAKNKKIGHDNRLFWKHQRSLLKWWFAFVVFREFLEKWVSGTYMNSENAVSFLETFFFSKTKTQTQLHKKLWGISSKCFNSCRNFQSVCMHQFKSCIEKSQVKIKRTNLNVTISSPSLMRHLRSNINFI